ncbi:glyoxal oxidase-like protein [Apodospora peruviana]|uniref:Glyoxal oxidase-like protein n=1 Tax=Apodospora peruviana TaxID=516989 RepID=A0AAE0MF27_9PEZI|nr:glyoxal oxidase-like protein [Apodospora peruviana]
MGATHAKSIRSVLFLSSLSLTFAQLNVPTNLPGAWTYQGCYTDVAGRTIGAAGYASATAMTNQACIAFCSNKGFQYAGTEYTEECFCGESLAAGAVVTTGCNMACSGDATQPCGGPSRLTLFYSSQPVGPQPNPGVNGFSYRGCYTEGTNGRALTYAVGTIPNAEMTVAKCTAACNAQNYLFAGVEYGGECFCGNSIVNGATTATSGCNMLCNGNQTEFCGGGSRLNVYGKGAAPSSSSSSSSTLVATTSSSTSTGVTAAATTGTTSSASSASSAVPTGPSQPAKIDNYNFYECRSEGTAARALTGATYASDEMTLQSCRAFCSAYTYFGVEYARECYCGNSFSAGAVTRPTSECSMTCAANPFQYCGAGNRLSVYIKDGTAPPPTSSTSSGASSSSVSSTAGPSLTGLPTGWTSQGCWRDGLTGRILPYQAPDSQTLTPSSCANLCKNAGYKISGTEYSVQCFCGNEIVNGGAQVAASECTNSCSGNTALKCGGPDRMSIISDGPPTIYGPPVPQQGGLPGWSYQGCYPDNLNDKRTFPWQLFFPGVMTAKMCLDKCISFGYHAAGLEYGEECYCGDPANIATVGATIRPESECGVVCAGNSSSICGGGSRLTTYFWTGTPKYSWSFPQDWHAGQYQHLIGGVNIPLMTMETVTGKVSFISKGGTGPGNETGAYELDLTKIAQGTAAFRTLHLKTDVFCAAGLTLPDKVGRQLTIGGWSGDSTYGTRLYWPGDTHDWEENVAELKLQKGRWYPSAMIMANGSIMVIGGEEGSNAAAVPSIEVLPYTGTAPLYMQWLADTNPNNLYPFVCVLPSGGIFVAYYNQARILNEVTFATTKTLPNAPGAVNDDTAGRTYPMEGAAVLLPQKWPYTANLEILLCGGSTIGVANALDNCVSTKPEDANPTWILERMPSPRVMPCMAPLPDGTYLIANGAKHGVAGFGLATDPNKNALLYDPTKPYGSRITVMANTTIARMYHSEAITLLDGRVLISGSNPEDGKNPEEYRVEVFVPPYLLSGLPRPTFAITNKDWAYGQIDIPFTLGHTPQNGPITVTLLGAVSSTHGNSLGARTLMPKMSCVGTVCKVDAPPNAHVCPPGWYQFFVLDGGIPAVGVYVRIGGDPAQLGNWPNFADFSKPGI